MNSQNWLIFEDQINFMSLRDSEYINMDLVRRISWTKKRIKFWFSICNNVFVANTKHNNIILNNYLRSK